MEHDEHSDRAVRESGADDVPSIDFTRFWCRLALNGTGALDMPADGTPPTDLQISVSLVDTTVMRELNRDYRQRDKPTNVLSFPSGMPVLDTDSGRRLRALGDICICPAVVVAEAEEQGKVLRHHWAHLLVHGVLHLCGHDHESDADAEEMEAIERRVLGEQAIPDPYAGDAVESRIHG
ncbi:MAG: rRNA maturation RNase YbeY [Gammaproteobacteria bacterium]|nr:MAG: rRNA maturation RNase YbeY [Gammaproteobacteria bacterium]